MRLAGPILAALLAAGFVLTVAPESAEAARPVYYESVLVSDGVGDYQGNGALDLVEVYVAEVAPYDLDNDSATAQIVLRIEPRQVGDIALCGVPTPPYGLRVACRIRYDAHFEANGKRHDLHAVIEPTLDTCCPVTGNVSVSINATSVKFLLDRAAMGLVAGARIEKLYVTSSLVTEQGGQTAAADRAPGDNAGLPYDQQPDLADQFATPYQLKGTYPFFTAELLTPGLLNSVDGQSVEFRIQVRPIPGVREDSVYIRWDTNWTVTPSRGKTGADPYGLLTGLSGGEAYPFDFAVSPRDIVDRGQVHTILTRLHSSSQGQVLLPIAVRITGPTFEDADYVFRLVDAPPLKAGTAATIRFQLADAAGSPRISEPVDVSFRRGGRLVANVPASAGPDGYSVTYVFPTAGTWVVEPHIRDLEPSPHGLFTVEVSKRGSPASAGLAASIVLLCVALLLSGHRVRHNRF